jgi:hypothetical protein
MNDHKVVSGLEGIAMGKSAGNAGIQYATPDHKGAARVWDELNKTSHHAKKFRKRKTSFIH